MTAALALTASLVWGVADFLGGTATRRLPVAVVIGGSQLLALLVLVPAALVLDGFSAPLDYLPWALGACLVGMVALSAFYHALAVGTMGVVAPIAAMSVIVPVIVGVAQGDRPGSLQILGMVAAAVGVTVASGPERRSGASLLPVGLALLAAVGFGLVLVFIARAAETSTVMSLLVMRGGTVLVLGVVLLGRGQPVRVTPRDLPLLAGIGVGDAVANTAFALSSGRGQLGLVSVLSSLYPAVVVLLARHVHHERLRPLQQGGVGAALVGVCLIAAGGGAG